MNAQAEGLKGKEKCNLVIHSHLDEKKVGNLRNFKKKKEQYQGNQKMIEDKVVEIKKIMINRNLEG